MRHSKEKLRTEFLAKRRQLDKGFIISQSDKMAERLYQWPCFEQAKIIMLFLSMPDEPQMMKIIEYCWQQGKIVCVPHMRKEFGMMDAAVIDNLDDLVQGRFNLMVPDPAKLNIVDPTLIDLIVVPAVAYDYAGNRVGMGAGYYDRFILEASQAVRIGAIWSSNIAENIPADHYDKPVHYLLTANEIIQCVTKE